MLASRQLNTSTSLRISLLCEVQQVRPAVRAAREFLAANFCTENELTACEYALAEACNNAVVYALPSRQMDEIELELSCDDTRIEIRVHDHTAGLELPAKVDLPDPESESGRGLFIILSMVDEVSYASGIGENTLTMRKFRNGSGSKTKKVLQPSLEELTVKLAESESIVSQMAEELSSCYESLSAIFRNGRELGKTDNIQKFSRSLCEDLVKITGSDWFLLRIVPKGETALKLFASSSINLQMPPILIPTDSRRMVSAELSSVTQRRNVCLDSQNPMEKADPLHAMPPARAIVIHPFYFAEALIGTLAIGKNSSSAFTAADVNVVQTFADFLAIQIANDRLHEEHLENQLVTRELEIARGIQRALLPKSLPLLPGFSLAGFCESARHVGGDFYDVVSINQHSALLVIADVMGKGVPAAMFAAILRSVLRGAPELASQPATLLSRVNHLLFADLSDVEMFITAQLAFVDVQKHQLVVASAGHCPALLVSAEFPEPKLISPDGMPLGILSDTRFTQIEESFSENSRLLLYTDGLTESRDGNSQFFGQARLISWINTPTVFQQNAEQLKKSLATELGKFQQQAPPCDDQTFLILAGKITPPNYDAS
ncbi:MAG: SpoIIE family protein phosphatase [Verrucomicrobiota bacterium]